MNLQGRNLSPGMTGDDVLLLKIELALLGYEVFEQPSLTHISPAQPVVDLYTPGVAAAVREVQAGCDLPQTGIVDEATAGCINAAVEQTDDYVAFGRVYGPDGESLPDVLVELLERDLPSREANGPRVIGETQTTPTGYFITYNIQQFADGEVAPPSPDLQIRLPEIADEENTPITSTIYYNAPRVQIIDVHLSRAQQGQVESALSEFERHMARVNPIVGDITPESWSSEDIAFLSGETGIPLDHLWFLNIAHQYEIRSQIPASAFYGMFRRELPTMWSRLLAQGEHAWLIAMEQAQADSIIPALEPAIDVIVEMLQAQIHDFIMRGQDEDGVQNIGSLVNLALENVEQRAHFAREYAAYDGNADEFWAQLRSSDAFGDDAVEQLRYTLQLGAITANHLPLVTNLLEEHPTLHNMAQWTQDDWLERIQMTDANNARIGVPAGIPGTSDDDQALFYADLLTRWSQRAAPTGALLGHVTRRDFDGKADIVTFLNGNPGFSIDKVNIRQYLQDDNAVLDNIVDSAGLEQRIAGIQRLYPLVDAKTDIALDLTLNGLDSAHALHRFGKERFVSQYEPIAGSVENAEKIMLNAEMQVLRSLAILSKYNEAFHRVTPYVIPHFGLEEMTEDERTATVVPTLRTLFGSLDFCQCEHCRSIYSAAAYLVDSLNFVDRCSLLDELRLLRPDILHIELTCKNTNTTLPYIDLVNEILEDAVYRLPEDGLLAPLLFTVPPDIDASREEYDRWHDSISRYQTTGTADELRALPEHTREKVYDDTGRNSVRNAVYPSIMPFDLWHETVELYLKHLGSSRYEIMRVFNESTRLQEACAYFGLTDVVCDIITNDGDAVDRLIGDYYGWRDRDARYVQEQLSNVAELLNRTQIDYQDLLQILETHYLNPEDTLYLDAPDEGCDPQEITLESTEADPPPIETFERLHRFLRLKRATGWTITELDMVIQTMGFTDIDRDLIVKLASVHQIQRELNLPVEEMLSFWGNINTSGKNSLYIRLFQNKAVSNPTHLDFQPDMVTRRIEGPLAVEDEHEPIILAALRLNSSDWDVLTSTGINNGELWLDNLSRLYRHTLLARSLALTIPELLLLLRLIDDDPFAVGNPDSTSRFIERVYAVRKSAFSLIELAYIFLHRADAVAVFAPAQVELDSVIRTLESAEDLTEELVIQTLAERLQLKASLIREMLQHYVVISVRDEHFQEELRNIYPRLHKGALLMSKFDFSSDELHHFITHPTDFGGFDLTALPMTVVDDATIIHPLFHWWEILHEYQMFRKKLPEREHTLIDVFSAEDLVTARERLSEVAGWKVDTFAHFETGDFRNVDAMINLHPHLALSKRLGVAPDQMHNWATHTPDAKQAEQVRQSVKAKYDEKRWLQIIESLEDVLREKRRDALIAFLLARADQWLEPDVYAELEEQGRKADTNMLYSRFLIDVEMSACQLTSRIKQANATVQLFIQRCLMRLEGDNTIPSGLAKEWQLWMKNYRVWEANRKVFVYPENWIDPEFIDIKTPFYVEAENTLLQNDITGDTVENVYRRYLERLDEVAKLDIVGMYNEEDSGTLHVFGRTPGLPHHYFYRLRESAVWTPWEKVDLDIEGDHLIPVVWNRRLYLFWAFFSEKSEEKIPALSESEQSATVRQKTSDAERPRARGVRPGSNEKQNKPEHPERHLEIQLAYSQYQDGRWTARKVSKDFIKVNIPAEESDQMYFAGTVEGTIKCYRLEEKELTHDSTISQYRRIGKFEFDSCSGRLKAVKGEVASDSLFLPRLTRVHGSVFEEISVDETGDLIENVGDLYLPEATNPTSSQTRLLPASQGVFFVLAPHQTGQFNAASTPFFFQDDEHVFFVQKEIPRLQVMPPRTIIPDVLPRLGASVLNSTYDAGLGTAVIDSVSPRNTLFALGNDERENHHVVAPEENDETFDFTILWDLDNLRSWLASYIFRPFHHPYVCDFIKQVNRYGIDGLLSPAPMGEGSYLRRQEVEREFFEETYDPEPIVGRPYPKDEIDFSEGGAYSQYNWELFFHLPLLIAKRLSQNQQFSEAMTWFHYIFDPTLGDDGTPRPEGYWKVKPFYEAANIGKTVNRLMRSLNEGDEELEKQVEQWRQDPFNPHLIARMRHTAYMKTVVMKYLDNLVAWGDYLFRLDTMETTAEAAQIYILVADILGTRPQSLPQQGETRDYTFVEIESGLDVFSNAIVEIEERLPAFEPRPGLKVERIMTSLPQVLYFCIPSNDKLVEYWDTIADRLFKLRHCMNIEGIVRQLPLFEPPIDPALLVRARAAGVDLQTLIAGIDTELAPYRFTYLLQKANEFCAEVKALGGGLLSALEKHDAEELALLRSSHEINLLDAAREIRRQQVEEAQENLEALQKQQEIVTHRRDFYRDIEKLSAGEKANLALLTISHAFSEVAQNTSAAASIVQLIPDFDVGVAGISSPLSKASFGGTQVGGAMRAIAEKFRSLASRHQFGAQMASTLAGYSRRWDEWKHREKLEEKDLEQLEKRQTAAMIRLAIAQNELNNHDRQRDNAREVRAMMQRKFTNQELYNWMVNQIAAIYFQSYKLALQIAQQAETASRYERGIPASDGESRIIQAGQWDSLRRGLLSGEQLQRDLRRLEHHHMMRHHREYELTRHISLVRHAPVALIELKQTGTCRVVLHEGLFNADYPTHDLRRIKSVSLTIPCVTGPYTSVNCTLTLLQSWVRVSSDSLIQESVRVQSSIATSQAQQDSGTFELNFHDERYLPFEGAGAISEWQLDLPHETNAFDFDTITDIVIHMNYSARESGSSSPTPTLSSPPPTEQPNLRLFSLRHEFANEWFQFLSPDSQVLRVHFSPDRFPYQRGNATIMIDGFQIIIIPNEDATEYFDSTEVVVEAPDGTHLPHRRDDRILKTDTPFSGLFGTVLESIDREIGTLIEESPSYTWSLHLEDMSGTMNISRDIIENIMIILEYRIVT